jgi:hypothetical protein
MPRGADGKVENRLPRGAGWPIFSAVARVAQLDRASVSEAEGCGFDPRLAHHFTNSAIANRRHLFRNLDLKIGANLRSSERVLF